MRQVFSYGGGRQAAAIVALLVQERLPRPDAIVMADTGREKSTTWAYLERYTGPALAKSGLQVEIAPHDLSTTDIRALNGMIQIPMFTRPSGQLWQQLPETDFKKAAELEAELFAKDGNVYLHPARRPISDVDFWAQQDLFEDEPGCRSGYCFT